MTTDRLLDEQLPADGTGEASAAGEHPARQNYAGGPAAPRPRVVPQHQAAGPRTQTVRVGVPPCDASHVETDRGPDGRVTAINVHCRCGEVIRIVCEY